MKRPEVKLLWRWAGSPPARGRGLKRKIIESTYEGAAEIWPTLEKVISAIVSMFNAVGIFKKS